MRQMLIKYGRVWLQLTRCSFATFASNKIDNASFLVGKIIRFLFFWLMIFAVFSYAPTIAGYGKYEMLFFVATFFFVDSASQAFLRGLYMFKQDINRGTFDSVLTQPINPLFFVMTRLTDPLDIITVVPLVGLIAYLIPQLGPVTAEGVLAYLLFLAISFCLILAIHIFSAALNIITLESDNMIWLYRNSMFVGLFPPEAYPKGMQIFFTFGIPILVVTAFPAKAYLGILSGTSAFLAFTAAIAFSFLSLVAWRYGLKKYTSASS